MKPYVRPEVLATYTVEELVEEAAVCVSYGISTGVPSVPPPDLGS